MRASRPHAGLQGAGRRRPAQRGGVSLDLELDAHVGHGRGVLVKLLIGAVFLFGLWLVAVGVAFFGWRAVLALASPMYVLAWRDPDRWGWPIGRSSPKSSAGLARKCLISLVGNGRTDTLPERRGG